MLGKPIILTGTDFLGTVDVAGDPTTASDQILAVLPITPSGYPGTRLTQVAPLYERYRFRSFVVRYVPSVPNTLGCQFIAYLDTDPLDDASVITDPDALIRQATAQSGAKQWNFNQTKAIPLAMRLDDQLYYTGVDRQNERFSRQGTIYLIQVTNPVSFDGSEITSDLTAGSLYLDWTCEFQIPQIEPSATSALPTFSLIRELIYDGSQLFTSPQSGQGNQDIGTFTLEKPYFEMMQVEVGSELTASALNSGSNDVILRLFGPNSSGGDVGRAGVTFLTSTGGSVYSDDEFEGASDNVTHLLLGASCPYGEWTAVRNFDITDVQDITISFKVYGFRLGGGDVQTSAVPSYIRNRRTAQRALGDRVWSAPLRKNHISRS
jgi:hypothetical protein